MKAVQRVAATFHVNGEARTIEVEPRRLLSDALRDELQLKGLHVGCEHGVCGACTILLDGRPVRSCLLFAVQADGRALATIESFGRDGRLTPLQQAMHEEHGLQCGFCTPGIVLTFEAFLAETPDPTEEQVREALSGNLCRCTGYQNVVRAILKAAKAMRESDAARRAERSQ